MLQGAEDPGNERSLGDYCAANEGLDIIVVSFLSSFGNGVYPSGYLGDCEVDADGSFSNCESLASDIDSCKSKGIKIFISAAGGGSNWNLVSDGDAKGVAYSLWNSYASPAATSNSPRPFGNTFVDGFDFDVEDNHNNEASQYLGTLVNALRDYFSSDSSNTYFISGAPQCPIPEPNMGDSIMQAQ